MSKLLSNLFAVKLTQLKMVRARGFNISAEANYFQYSEAAFLRYITEKADRDNVDIRETLRRAYEPIDTENDKRKLLVYYSKHRSTGKQVGDAEACDFTSQMKEGKFTDGIFITQLPLSSQANETLRTMITQKIWIFFDNQLTFDVTEHYLVPRHELLTREEAKQLLLQARCQPGQLPIIREDDPIVRYYGWPARRIVRIHRYNFFMDVLVRHTVGYRIIVPVTSS